MVVQNASLSGAVLLLLLSFHLSLTHWPFENCLQSFTHQWLVTLMVSEEEKTHNSVPWIFILVFDLYLLVSCFSKLLHCCQIEQTCLASAYLVFCQMYLVHCVIPVASMDQLLQVFTETEMFCPVVEGF